MRVSNDQRRTVIGFGFVQSLDRLHVVGADRNLRNVNVAVGHGDHTQILLRQGLAGSGKLGRSAHRGRLRLLTAGVGIYARIHNQNVDVLAGSDRMIQTAETDVIGPAVAAQNPYRLLDQVIGQFV